ncbi:MAG: crotonase/enoyl-CoA hydratase family protein, partial [Burkholderiaceae bacterium]|nr:crotonase/enoyl-CoA hydratase family protein [Microbacteriaceae bacterium]
MDSPAGSIAAPPPVSPPAAASRGDQSGGDQPGGDHPRVTVERDGHVLLIGLNRPEKRNAADYRMLTELALAYGELDRDPELRAGLVFAHGDHFTAGLDLADVAPRIGPDGIDLVPDGGLNPWQVDGTALTKPVVMTVQGTCLTLGIELILASDITVAAESTTFGQIEVSRGILPFGGATIRLPRAVGWGNAMRWTLTGDGFGAAEALRIGLVQEVVADGQQYTRGLELAHRIAA